MIIAAAKIIDQAAKEVMAEDPIAIVSSKIAQLVSEDVGLHGSFRA